ncbi:MAG: hypothetical protein K6A29_01060, partial [Lachnospiraceae bacterium]|nr:hypothetical protein [Lachnospiraceae bacterium]
TAEPALIENLKLKDGYGLDRIESKGEVRAIWDGPTLYLGITVYDKDPVIDENTKKGAVSNPAVAGSSITVMQEIEWWGHKFTYPVTITKETADSVVLGIDLYNDKEPTETDTTGVVTFDIPGNIYYYQNKNIPSLSSPLGDELSPEYMDIIKEKAGQIFYDEEEKPAGYVLEIAISIEDTQMTNGTEIGMDLKINDMNNVVVGYEEVKNPEYKPSVSENDVSGNDVTGNDASGNDASGNDNSQNEVVNNQTTSEDVSGNDNTKDKDSSDGSKNSTVIDENNSNELNNKPAEEKSNEEGENLGAKDTAGDTSSNDSNAGPVSTSSVTEIGEKNVDVSSNNEELNGEPNDAETQVIEVPEFIEKPVTELKKSADIFFSHSQDSVYEDFDHEHARSVDWATITLTGWNGEEFAYSDWGIQKALRYIDSLAFPKGVYTEESQKNLDKAIEHGKMVVSASYKSKETAREVTKELKEAIKNLKWKDTRYPDPSDLSKQNTLPNTYQFFNSSKVVTNNAEWEARREEILDLAQFYEYGYKPEYDNLKIAKVEEKLGQNKKISITATVTVGDKSKDIKFDVAMPTEEQIAANGHEGKRLPIVLTFDGTIGAYSKAGLAQITVPGVVSDTRTNDYAWVKRSGTFYELYPYSRNGEAALKEVSNEMASAWAASLVIDALQMCEESENETFKNAVKDLDVDKYAVTGFSINGKYAFVAGVFDDRIDVVIPGASGATGTSPWRYVYRGQEYDWSGTIYENPMVDSYQVAGGTEIMAHSVRHNRARTTELFRQFLNPGHFTEYEDGAYGYGTRLPFDQNDLVATLAPRALIIENTVNDYNDGCISDCLSAEIGKSVYRNLGYNADDLIKYNLRNLMPGDPHGSDDAQRGRSAEYLNYYFFGTAMSEETASYLGQDPFALNISNDKTQTPYDYYWGGFNTITGGKNGVDGKDGWYNYKFPVPTRPSSNDDDDERATTVETTATETAPATGTVTAQPQRRTTTRVAVAPVTEEVTEEITEVTQETSKEEIKEEEVPKTDSVEETKEEVKEETNIENEEVPLTNLEPTSKVVWPWIVGVVLIILVAGGLSYAYYLKKKNLNN